ncbi:dol-P-Man:Man(7)GlcNAc(2)-PP-Dol alpha-1,6-mannosyltransferase-like [Xenia sp. Carnegie-2017]|uniref:dol-P-Man:Man(7)GlcNAc(2)-PP-Dol alpha-1,6-mannosyltransferase-like n=1 Tax=Xenia sp. Carnegie-2017 TaxID=2897299 RepID=UPI001F03B4FF|nr:dol-P-Man:Man(7)GlcNAc(2)-PP-Dol alpha-1,6-mannosyltransferase-like [Xenia sp. Carnegie-2017]
MDLSLALDLGTLLIVLSNILFCPYTKVEESFNIQATHDILYHGFNISKYDHVEFPGVVPRTFIGPLSLAILSYPFINILKVVNASKMYSQIIVRSVLGVCSSASFSLFRRGVGRKFGSTTSNFLAILTISQFHLVFYMSRTLPNTFALNFALCAFYCWFTGNHPFFIWLSGFGIILFRAELAIVMGLIMLLELYEQRISLARSFVHIVLSGIAALGLTVSIDSYFWGRFCWPEAEVFFFNTVQNQSSNWGTSPFLWYFYSAIPRSLLLLTIILIFYGLWIDKRPRTIFGISIVYILLFSFLPHKELRFIFYILPLLNVVAAVGLNFIYMNIWKWRLRSIIATLVIGGLISNVTMTTMLMYISSLNYPGGSALNTFHHQVIKRNSSPQSLHICNLAAQTGVTRFGQVHPYVSYSKKDIKYDDVDKLKQFSYLILEGPCSYSNELFESLQEIYGFDGLTLHFDQTFPYIKFVKFIPKLCILKRRFEP